MEIRTQIFATTHATKRGETVDAQSLQPIAKQFAAGASSDFACCE
jgi:hypothetical protein